MDKRFKIIVIDDDPDNMKIILRTVEKALQLNYNYEIEYEILSKSKEVDKLKDMVCDIVMFDCALSGEDYNFEGTAESRYGFELIKKYRENNKRTKIIFYSGSFDFDDEGSFDLSILEFVKIINELNIFAITNRETRRLVEVIKKAIDELDTILISLEDLISQYGEDGIFVVGDKKITSEQLLSELKLGTALGEIFRENIYTTIISYFMKFGEDKN